MKEESSFSEEVFTLLLNVIKYSFQFIFWLFRSAVVFIHWCLMEFYVHPLLSGAVLAGSLGILALSVSGWLSLLVLALYGAFWGVYRFVDGAPARVDAIFRPFYSSWNRRWLKRQICFFLADFYLGSETEELTKRQVVKKVGKQFTISQAGVEQIYRVRFTTPVGKTDDELVKHLEVLASDLGVFRYSVDDPEGFGNVSCVLAFEDVLSTDLNPYLSGIFTQKDAKATEWLTVGITPFGEEYRIPLVMKNGGGVRALHQGISRSGKSSIVKQQLAWAIANPDFDVVVTDGKGSEFGWAEPYAVSFWDGQNIAGFWDQIRFLENEVARRAKLLSEHKRSNPHRSASELNPADDGEKYLLWVFDELARVRSLLPKTSDQFEFENRINGIVSVAGSLGICVIFSAQAFRNDVLPTLIRNNSFDLAIGYKSLDIQESSYIGFSADDPVRPDTISGGLDPSTGRASYAGQFVARGLGGGLGKAYFVPEAMLAEYVKKYGVRVKTLENVDFPSNSADNQLGVRG